MNLEALSFECRQNVLDMIMEGRAGHIGGDFSVMDILITLYFKQMNISPDNLDDPDRDLFVMSKGHSVEAYYAVLAAKGFLDIEDVIKNFSKFGSPYIGHPNNKLPGIEMNSGSLGHGLPVCVGMALANKMDGKTGRVYTVMGDGELAEGSVWEGAMAAGHYKLDNLCAVVDRNRLQISGNTEDVMADDDLDARFRAFGWNSIHAQGNNIESLNEAFEEAKTCKGKPTVIIADTIKGYGGGEIMENKADWHHKVPTQEMYETISAELLKRIANRQVICETLMEQVKEDKSIVALCSDSRGSASMTPFFNAYPENSVEIGIAEQNLVSISAGMAKCGKKPFCFSPASFISTRSYEQAKVDVAYSNTNVKLVGISGGISYGELGMSHHSAQDIAAMSAIPNMRVYLPSDRFQTKHLIEALLKDEKPAYIRTGRNPVEDIYSEDNCPFEMDKATVIKEGTDVVLIGCGEMVRPCVEAAEILEKEGISATVLDMYCVKPLDTEAIIKAATNAKAVVTAEEHAPFGGLGSMVAQVVGANCPKKVVNVALPDAPVITGNSKAVFDYYGMNGEGIAAKAKEALA